MEDQTYSISQLTEANTATDNTLIEVVIDPDTSPKSRKMKRSTYLADMATEAELAAHTSATNNPHSTTKAQVGLANVPNADATNRANHTGTQPSSTISDFQEAVQDAVAALLAEGTSISLSYDDAANSLTITGTGGGEGGGLDAEAVRDAIGVALIGLGAISVTVDDAADTITISTTATQNDTDANLKNRANHTGSQAISTVTNLQDTLDAKAATSAVVTISGDQAVDGVKTFSSSPIVPTPTDDMQAATKKYVDDNAGDGSGTPGGSTTQIQYNNAGAFAGNADLTWDNTTNAKAMTVKGKVTGGDFLIGADSYTPTVVYVGDSLTYGVGEADYPYNHYITLPTWNGFTFDETNIGVGGLTVYQMKARMAQYHNVLYHQKSPLNISVVWGGINDLAIANGSHSPQELYSVMAEFCKHARQLGWRVVVMTMLSGDNGAENFETSKNVYNGLLRSTWNDFADLLIDVAANANLGADGAHSNSTYFHDGVHLTNTGYALVGSIVEEALTSYIEQALTIRSRSVEYIQHDADADYPRPIGAGMVFWIGSVQPNNAISPDQWIGPAS